MSLSQRALNLKKRIAAGDVVRGLWVHLPSSSSFEVIAEGGFDWILVDAEHAAFSPDTLLHMLMAVKRTETVPVVRVAANDASLVKQVLDLGYDGVVLPGIASLEDVKLAVSACRYPPIGNRGFGPVRASGYGDQKAYAQTANDAIICCVQIEDIAAVDEIDEIVKVPGLDWIMTGPNDMSGSAGCFLETHNPKVQNALDKIAEAAQKASLPLVESCFDLEAMQQALKDGIQVLLIGQDVLFLQQAMDNAIKMLDQALRGTTKISP